MIRHVVMFKLKDMSDFDAFEDTKMEVKNRLETCSVHPAHQEVVRFIGSIKETSASVDFVI